MCSFDARSWDHPTHPLKVTLAVALLDELFEHPAGLFWWARGASRVSARFVEPWNAGAYPAQDFIRDCADPGGHFISPD